MAYVGIGLHPSPLPSYCRRRDRRGAFRRKRARERPEPQHKHVWAEITRFKEGEVLAAAPMLFFEILMECCRRDPANKKPCICVMDG